MRIFFVLFQLLCMVVVLKGQTTHERVNEIVSLIKTNSDSAFTLANQLLEESKSRDDAYGKVQSNFIMAYINENNRGDFGKAIIYYLEAIRYGKRSNYDGVINNLSSLHKNSGAIFRKFNAYTLAEEYYGEALYYARLADDDRQVLSLKYNISALYRDQEKFDDSITILNEILDQSEQKSSMYFKALNRLSFTYYEIGNLHKAKKIC